MGTPNSVTTWIDALKGGDPLAAQPLWERYHARLIALARKKLASARRGEADEDDVVQNAFHSFFRGVSDGRFPVLNDRDNLWRILVVITARKAYDQIARQNCRISAEEAGGIEQIIGEEPSPEFAAQVAEQCEYLLNRLGDDTLREVALWKMEGHTREEIAAKLDVSTRTVARKLDTIRIVWEGANTP